MDQVGNPVTRPAWWRSADAGWMLAILLLGLAARLFQIDGKPFWLDEVLTLQRIHLDTSGLVADSFANRHMPSYFLLLRLISLWDDGVATLRLPSALFGALSASMVYAVARSAVRSGSMGRSAGIVAGLLMALSPQQVQYGQEARSYTLEILLITAALWGLVRLARDPRAAAMDVRDPRSKRLAWAGFTLGTLGALDVLGDAAPWLVAANLSLLLIWRQLPQSAARRRFLLNWGISQLIVAAFCLPFYGLILAASDGQMMRKFDWIPGLSWHHVWVSASSAYLMRMAAVVRFDLVPTAAPLLAPIVAILGAFGLFKMRKHLEGRVLALGFAVLPLLVLAASAFKPMLVPRYILWSAAPFFVLTGLGAASLPRRTLPVVASALMLLGMINLAPTYKAETKPRWDLAAATLADRIRPGDTVFTADPNAPTMITELQPKTGMPIETTALVTPRLDLAMARWKQGGRVWAVHGSAGLGKPEGLGAFLNRISALGIPSMQLRQGEQITILLFQPPAVIQ